MIHTPKPYYGRAAFGTYGSEAVSKDAGANPSLFDAAKQMQDDAQTAAGARAKIAREEERAERGMSPLWIAWGVAKVFAVAISYSRNKSLLWAFGTGFVATPYLAYMGLLKLQGKPVLKKNPSHKRRKAKRGSRRRKTSRRRSRR